jgi:hypothetical protein
MSDELLRLYYFILDGSAIAFHSAGKGARTAEHDQFSIFKKGES